MNTDDPDNIVIVGAGQAGLQAAQSLRKRGFDGRLALIGDEPYLPYQRPPLSKAFLKSELDESRLFFRPARFYADQDIDFRPNSAAVRLDTAARRVECADGRTLSYDRLVLATGARPVRLPIRGADLPGVFELRGIDDSKTIRDALRHTSRLLVVGGGYIGLEVAAAVRHLEHDVTVVERLPRLLSRVTSPPVSDFYLDLHRGHGVDVRLDETVEAISGDQSVTGVRLASGSSIGADGVLIGVGVRPADEIAATAGIACDDGVLVDADGLTSDACVYAAGDCARRRLPGGGSLRLESVHNALDQGERVAAAIAGDAAPGFDPPWFWSDQYDVRLQTVGLFECDDSTLIRGDVAAKRFAVLYFRDDELVAVDAVNDPASHMAARRMLRAGRRVMRRDLEDPDVTLKSLATA